MRLHLQRYLLNVHYILGRDIPVAKIPDYTYTDKNEKPCPFNSRHTHCHCHKHIMCMITEITVIDGLIFKGQSVVVIPKQRSEVLETIQSGHLRIEKLSRESLFSLYLHVF